MSEVETHQEVWLNDLTQCEPHGAISRDGREGTWVAVDYEVEAGKGIMLYGLPELNPPELRLKFNVTGWHEVRLGIFYGAGAGHVTERFLLARLSGDVADSRFGNEVCYRKDGVYPEKALGCYDIAESFWKCADLTGEELIINHPPRGSHADRDTNLAYVRLVPMDDAAKAEWAAEQPTDETKSLMANLDGGNISQWGVSTREDVQAEFECLRDSDFEVMLYGIAASCRALYPSKYPDCHSTLKNKWTSERAKNGVDLLAEAVAAAHDSGVKIIPQNRLCGVNLPPRNHNDVHRGEFMADHPEWLCAYADGEPTRHLSFAFQGVRDFHIRFMREWVEDYGADGVGLVFSRSEPFVFYEEPVRQAFKEKYGEDISNVELTDERVWAVQATFMTQFMREVRAMLDEVGEVQSRSLYTCYTLPIHGVPPEIQKATEKHLFGDAMFYGLDVETWVKEGLVDYLDLHLQMFEEHDGSYYRPVVTRAAEWAKGTRTKVMANIYPRRLPPEQYRRIAMTYYDAGADGISFWDAHARYTRASEWAFMKRLGHRDDLAGWEERCKNYYRIVPLTRLDQYLMDRVYTNPSDG